MIWNFKFCIKNSLLVKVECYKISFMLFSLFKKLTQNIIIIKLYNNLYNIIYKVIYKFKNYLIIFIIFILPFYH